jgi:hypothetical protein
VIVYHQNHNYVRRVIGAMGNEVLVLHKGGITLRGMAPFMTKFGVDPEYSGKHVRLYYRHDFHAAFTDVKYFKRYERR